MTSIFDTIANMDLSGLVATDSNPGPPDVPGIDAILEERPLTGEERQRFLRELICDYASVQYEALRTLKDAILNGTSPELSPDLLKQAYRDVKLIQRISPRKNPIFPELDYDALLQTLAIFRSIASCMVEHPTTYRKIYLIEEGVRAAVRQGKYEVASELKRMRSSF